MTTRTRSQIPAMSGDIDPLREILQELAQLREEQKMEREQIQQELRQRDETLRRMEQEIAQISRSNNSVNVENERVNVSERDETSASSNINLGYKLKPDTFDGTGSLREFFTQFELIARANRWTNELKTVALASSLGGKARSVLDCIKEIEKLEFAELKSRLELRFGEGHLSGT